MREKQRIERTGSKKRGSTGDRTKKWRRQASGKLQKSLFLQRREKKHFRVILWLEESTPQSQPPLTGDHCLAKAALGLVSTVQPAEGESQQPAHLNVHGKKA